MASDAAISSFLKRSRAHYGLDPDAPASAADFEHVAQLAQDMYCGRRPDAVPEGYEPIYPLCHSATPRSTAASTTASADDAAEFLSRLTLSVAQDGPQTTSQPAGAAAAGCAWADLDGLFAGDAQARAELEAIEAEAGWAGEEKEGAREMRIGNIEQAVQLREKEMTTKDGRAKWDRLEIQWRCPGRWKRAKERAMEARVAGKLDWRDTAEAVRVVREKRKEKGTTQAGAAGNAKGKKKGKK